MPRPAEELLGLRERHKQTTRRALVEVALELFDERGYAGVTVEDICARVDVSSRTFFRYFAAKEQVLAAPITELLELVQALVAAEPRQGAAWPVLRRAFATAMEHVEQRRVDFLRVSRVVRRTPEALAASARAFMEWELAVRGEVARRVPPGGAVLRPAALLGVAVVAMRTALDHWTDGECREPLAELVREALDLVEPGAVAIENAGAAAH